MYEGRRAQSPFDDSAPDRLRRMGLTDEKGSPDRDSLSICSCIFAGQFIEEVCDYLKGSEDVRELNSVMEKDIVTNFHVTQILILRRELLDALEAK